MNRLPQTDIHPDADTLSAFAERALPDAESAQIVGHLAACGRCREVVFLAQDAAEAEVAALEAARQGAARPGVAGFEAEQARGGAVVREPRPARISAWWAKWRQVWIPAAALAAVSGVVVWVQLRPAPPAITVARNAPQQHGPVVTPAVPAEMSRASAPPPAAASASASAPAPPIAAQRPSARNAKPAASAMQREARKPHIPSFPARSEEGTAMDSSQIQNAAIAMAPAPPKPAATSLTAVPSPSEQANTNWKPQSPGLARAAAGASFSPTPPAAASRTMALHGVAMAQATGSAASQKMAEAAPPTRLQFSAQPLNGMMALRMTRHPALPSGLNTVSTAAVLDRLLAIDSAGAVYLSHDAGRHWETVAPQWNGKAVEVIAQPRPLSGFNRTAASAPATATRPDVSPDASPDASPATSPDRSPTATDANAALDFGASATPPANPVEPSSAPFSPRLKAAAPVPAMLFKLVNDRHQSWVSVDGKVWRAQ